MPTLSYHRAGIRVRVTAVHQGIALSSTGGSETPRTASGVKAGRWFSLAGSIRRPAFNLPVHSLSNEMNTAFDIEQERN